jgi:hypothetical protein
LAFVAADLIIVVVEMMTIVVAELVIVDFLIVVDL